MDSLAMRKLLSLSSGGTWRSSPKKDESLFPGHDGEVGFGGEKGIESFWSRAAGEGDGEAAVLLDGGVRGGEDQFGGAGGDGVDVGEDLDVAVGVRCGSCHGIPFAVLRHYFEDVLTPGGAQAPPLQSRGRPRSSAAVTESRGSSMPTSCAWTPVCRSRRELS